MPYGRRTTRRRYTSKRKYSYKPRALSTKTVAKIAKREIRRDNLKEHPLQWIDILFTGGNVNTTPTMHSLVRNIANQLQDNPGVVEDWPTHDLGSRSAANAVKQARYAITYLRWQLRYQQDVENIEPTNTFRAMMYSYIDTLSENNVPILSGLDIDQPANTEKVKNMYFDHMRHLRAGTYDPGTTDEADPTPGTTIIKGTKKLNHHINYTFTPGESDIQWDQGDIRFESQSDTVANGLQLYGYIRVYYRRLF